MRADRLLSILMLLQTRGKMTARELAKRLEVSERTIYRDLEALSMAGIPVYTERGPGGGCSLLGGYQTRLTGLTETEVRALFLLTMAAPLVDLGLGKALEEALLKLTAALPASSQEQVEQVHQRFHIDTTWWYHTADAQIILQTLQQAIWQNNKLRIVYLHDNGNSYEQTIEPYGLVAKAGVWYLVSADHTGYSVYRVSRIQSVIPSEEGFVRDSDFDLADYWSDYCTRVEHMYPQYAIPLRLAPDEIPTFSQRLHNWGYRLIENDEALHEDGDIHGRPMKHNQPKKGSLIPSAWALSPQRSAHQLFVLGQTGQWHEVRRQSKKKRAGQYTFPPGHSFKAQSGPNGGEGKKKKQPAWEGNPRLVIQKSPLRANQKKRAPTRTKKKLFFSTPAPLLRPA